MANLIEDYVLVHSAVDSYSFHTNYPRTYTPRRQNNEHSSQDEYNVINSEQTGRIFFYLMWNAVPFIKQQQTAEL